MKKSNKTEILFAILGNQLFDPKILKQKGCKRVFMAEDNGLCTYQKHHKLKLYLFLCSMREYRDELVKNGIKVDYFTLEERTDNLSYLHFLGKFLQENKIMEVNFFEIEDKFFQKALEDNSRLKKFKFKFHASPMFMYSREEFEALHRGKKSYRLANFYKTGRRKFNILVDEKLEPIGGRWSFDEDNRKKIPVNKKVPDLKVPELSRYHSNVKRLVESRFKSHVGNLDQIWFPVQRNQVKKHLNLFLEERLEFFGVYEDAMQNGRNFLFHSCISPFLNIGLLTPETVLDSISKLFKKKGIPINSAEGFIRQILGWREFIRGIYHLSGEEQRSRNFWNHKNSLTKSWYVGKTGIEPLDDCINSTIRDGYHHHIPRLMVISNLMNLCEIDPANIYKWFMEMYVDSSDWVMVPNVFGMATFADGGLMSTKPYTCGSNYLLKMSDYKKGPWCDVVDGLYWRFIDKHKAFYKSNSRLSFQVKLLERMKIDRKNKIFESASLFLKNHTC